MIENLEVDFVDMVAVQLEIDMDFGHMEVGLEEVDSYMDFGHMEVGLEEVDSYMDFAHLEVD